MERVDGKEMIGQIHNEDCLETMARMPDGFIDLTVTSPPYDDLRKYNGYSFDFEAVAKGLYRVTKDGGVVVWVVGDKTHEGSETGTIWRQAFAFRDAGFNIHDTMIYEKATVYAYDPRNKRYKQAFEYMFVFTKGSPATYNPIKDKPCVKAGTFQTSKSGRAPDGSQREINPFTIAAFQDRYNIWRYGTGKGLSSSDDLAFGHPAIFPEQLAKDHIYSWSNPNDLVYDPFSGSGTTAKAAHQLGRRWVGSEISAEYVELANKRLEPYLAQESLF